MVKGMPQVPDASGTGGAVKVKNLDFDNRRVHFVQVGLGTNSTFIQNCAGEPHEWDWTIQWLMKAMSDQRPVEGVAVEPVVELVDALRGPVAQLPGVELVQVALGEQDYRGAELSVFGLEARNALLQRVPRRRRESLKYALEYIVNMSCIGSPHPRLPDIRKKITDEYNLRLDMECRRVDVWTWGSLVKSCKFRGCEVLLVDAEGYDAQILRSLIKYCQCDNEAWPHLIQFETMGHCDQLEGEGTEWSIVRALEEQGYMLVSYSYRNTHLVLKEALLRDKRLKSWVGTWKCSFCYRRWQHPYWTQGCRPTCKRCRFGKGGALSWSSDA